LGVFGDLFRDPREVSEEGGHLCYSFVLLGELKCQLEWFCRILTHTR
jgi:hypothetical protein